MRCLFFKNQASSEDKDACELKTATFLSININIYVPDEFSHKAASSCLRHKVSEEPQVNFDTKGGAQKLSLTKHIRHPEQVASFDK